MKIQINHYCKKQIISLLLILLFSFCYTEEKIISLEIGQTGGNGYSLESGPYVSWLYSYKNSFFSVTGGSQYKSDVSNSTIQTVFDKNISTLHFDFSFSTGIIYHVGILVKKAFLQDEHFFLSCNVCFRPINVSLNLFGGCGFNNTYAAGKWMNNFYPIFQAGIEWIFFSDYSIEAGVSSFDFFDFDGFPSPRFYLSFSDNFSDKLKGMLGVVLRFSNMDLNSHDNIHVDHLDFKATLSYAL
ncbi:MAG: hypothetical protein HUJ68_05410 [Clostridia bacterium]|nr:hypothetical protein [Clostridia bacterium]